MSMDSWISTQIAQLFMGVCPRQKAEYIMAFRSYSDLDILLPSIIIIMQVCSQTWVICKCLYGILWRCVWHAANPIDYLLLSLQYVELYVFNWPMSVEVKGYIYSSCYYHLRKRWRATAWCGKSKFTISSGWLKNGSLCHPDDIITLS